MVAVFVRKLHLASREVTFPNLNNLIPSIYVHPDPNASQATAYRSRHEIRSIPTIRGRFTSSAILAMLQFLSTFTTSRFRGTYKTVIP